MNSDDALIYLLIAENPSGVMSEGKAGRSREVNTVETDDLY